MEQKNVSFLNIYLFLHFLVSNQEKNVINEIIEEEDEEKNNKINENKESDNVLEEKNHIDIKFSDNKEKHDKLNIKKKIKYISYNKINIEKHNSEPLIKNQKNDNRKLISQHNNNKTINNNFIYHRNMIKEMKLNNNSNNSSCKNIFNTKISLSNFYTKIKDIKDKRNYFSGKWSSLSSRQSNSNENIFNKKSNDNNLSIKEKIIKEKNLKKSATLPELNHKIYKNSIKYENIINENYNTKKKSKTIFDEKLKRTKSVFSDKTKMNSNNFGNNNLINYSPSTSEYANYTKKMTIDKINNLIDNQNKFRIGLLSAGSSSYNSVMIPMISLNRPGSNFKINENKIWNNFGDINGYNLNKKNNLELKNEIKDKVGYDSKPKEKDDIIIFKKNKNNSNEAFNTNGGLQKNQNYNEFGYSDNSKNLMFKNMEKCIPKFHKIKIEKGMMNSEISKSLGRKLFINYYNQHNKNGKIPLKFDNNEDKINSNLKIDNV